MIFHHPWLALLLIPIAFVLYRHRHVMSATVLYLRWIAIFILVGALTEPSCVLQYKGIDVVVLVDRSNSMPAETEDRAKELIQILEKEMQPGDRMSVVSFAQNVHIDEPLEAKGFQGFAPIEPRDASNITLALTQALELIPNSRPGKIVLISDGKNTDAEYDLVRNKAQARNIPIFIRLIEKNTLQDIAITDIQHNASISKGESVSVQTHIYSPSNKEVTIRIERNGHPIATGKKQLHAGFNSIQLYDTPTDGGIQEYEVIIESDTDVVLENNRGVFAVLVEGPKKVLVINASGMPNALSTSIEGTSIIVETMAPGERPFTLSMLSQYQAVVMQNVPSTAFTTVELQNMVHYVTDLGGGFWMTGGRSSFGMGGYLHTPIEDILPVNLQIRDSRKKIGIALGIALDRSGSMGMDVGPNLTKMDLANQGAYSAINLLSPIDSVTVHAVDTESHMVIPLQAVSNANSLKKQVLGIESEGGGIYVYTALEGLYTALQNAKQMNKHIVLFADASDAEQEKDVHPIISKIREADITISVIALGTPQDSDANFLANVALQGGGDIYFTVNPAQLPALFAMDTMISSKSAFVDTETPVEAVLGLHMLGGDILTMPAVNGYNISFYKNGSEVGYRSKEDDHDPILTMKQFGLGKSVAFTGQIGGDFGSGMESWSELSKFSKTIITGISSASTANVPYMGVQKEGKTQVYTVESPNGPPIASVYSPTGEIIPLQFSSVAANTYEARLEQNTPGIHVATVTTDSGSVLLPPISLAYATEYSQRNKLHDERELHRLTKFTGGAINPPMDTIFKEYEKGLMLRSIKPWLLLLGLCVALLEISERKISLLHNFFQQWTNWRKSKTHGVQKKQTISLPTVSPVPKEIHNTSSNTNNPSNTEVPKKEEKNSTTALQEALKKAKKH